MSYEPDNSPYLIQGTCFWHKSTRYWTFCTDSLPHSNVTSAIHGPIFDLHHISLANYSSIMNFSYILIDFLWWHVIHRVLHIWPIEHISGPRVLDLDRSIQTRWLHLIFDLPDSTPFLTYWTYFWPKNTQSCSFYTVSLTPSDLRSARE